MKADKGAGNPKAIYHSALGAQSIELETNRPDLASEKWFFLKNLVAIKAYQWLIDDSLWFLVPTLYTSAVICLWYVWFLNTWAAAVAFAIPVFLIVPCSFFLWNQSKATHGSDLIFRLVCIAAGVLVAIIPEVL